MHNFLLKSGDLCSTLKDFSACLVALCVGVDMEWVRACYLEVRLDTSELEN